MTNKIVSRLNILIIEGQPKRETERDTSAFLNFWIATKRTRTTTTALKEKKNVIKYNDSLLEVFLPSQAAGVHFLIS